MTAKSNDEKMAVSEGSINANDNEEEEDEEEEMDEENTSVIKLDLPPGRQEHQKLTDHTICLDNSN